ncbi:ATP-dependent nuclease [Lactiplantibacillus plantarum]|uniref:ATP-dependent nuclease n=1 Tax=Lactiplantibacillus plantarum TaxID=1590 RepID=UPI0007BB56BA|nr:AAA family ATPase [Lactiplantibacillus plantarum]KZU57227.1 putative ATP-dependent endonucleaseof the OLD family [Lactiplantibacillus plantarum]
MFISSVEITNFRTFKEKQIIRFTEGINILVGPNNIGKTTIISAIRLIFDKNKFGLDINDFSKTETKEELKNCSPKITVSVNLQKSNKEGSDSDDLLAIRNWLTDIDNPYKAKITMQFQLPTKYEKAYLDAVKDLDDIGSVWLELEDEFLPKYQRKYFVGESAQPLMDNSLSRFNCQYLPAIRDAEKRMNSGNKYLLNKLLNFFIDYDLKSNDELKKSDIEKKMQKRHKDFHDLAVKLLNNLSPRFKEGKKEMLKYSSQTGATFDGEEPEFNSALNDHDILKEFSLVVKNGESNVPINLNGLGYNNLIYISLVLAELQQSRSNSYFGDNSSVFPFLLIEEPEAHLHPDMQYDFLKFLQNNIKDGTTSETAKQVIITTHSPNITAAASLDDLIVLSKYKSGVKIGYPGETFIDNPKDKKFVERFLDVTRSNLFFTNQLILIEGLAEQMLIPQFMKADTSNIQNRHISIINLSGRYFIPFLRMFDTNKNPNTAIYKQIACLTDLDPVQGKQNKSCPPIFQAEPDNKNPNIESIKALKSANIKVFSQDEDSGYKSNEGWTFEYQLYMDNPDLMPLIFHDSMRYCDAWGNLKKMSIENLSIEKISNTFQNERSKQIDGILKENHNTNDLSEITDSKLIKLYLGTMFLYSIKDKGLYAQELSEEISSGKSITVPKYIKKCFKWMADKNGL